MTAIGNALLKLRKFFKINSIPYMIIGGLANLIWGEPRLTQDIDVTISVPDDRISDLVEKSGQSFGMRVKDPETFVKQVRVLPVRIDNINVDLVLAGLDYELQAIKRAKIEDFEGIKVKVCSPEDLIIFKAISGRERDQEDIEGVLLKQGNKLDKNYIIKWLSEFSKALDKPVDKRFQQMWTRLVKKEG